MTPIQGEHGELEYAESERKTKYVEPKVQTKLPKGVGGGGGL
jgi:hypothetical protein